MPKSKLKQKQQQKQKQTVIQKVVIKLDKEGRKIKVKRRRTKKQPIQEGEDEFQKYNPYWRQLPAPSVFINAPTTPQVPQQLFNPPKEIPSINPLPRTVPFLEDVGTVGTEGSVVILDRPTKREQLDELITPVSKEKMKKYNEDFMNMLDEKRRYFKSLEEPRKPPFLPEQRIEMNVESPNVDEGLAQFEPVFKQSQFGIESPFKVDEIRPAEPTNIEEGLSQFEPAFKQSQFGIESPSKVDEIREAEPVKKKVKQIRKKQKIILEEDQPPLETKVKQIRGPRKNTWNDLLNRYNAATGQLIKRNQVRRPISDFRREVEQLEKKVA